MIERISYEESLLGFLISANTDYELYPSIIIKCITCQKDRNVTVYSSRLKGETYIRGSVIFRTQKFSEEVFGLTIHHDEMQVFEEKLFRYIDHVLGALSCCPDMLGSSPIKSARK